VTSCKIITWKDHKYYCGIRRNKLWCHSSCRAYRHVFIDCSTNRKTGAVSHHGARGDSASSVEQCGSVTCWRTYIRACVRACI